MLRKYSLKNYRFRLIVYVLILSIIGILMIGSYSSTYQYRQIAGVAAGLVIMLVLSVIDYNLLTRFSLLLYLVSVGLLILVLFKGHSSHGATRWIGNDVFMFQPSDFVKLLLIIFFAAFLTRFQEHLNTLPVILFYIALCFVPVYLIYREPNLSTTIIVSLIFITLLFIAGLSYKIVLSVLAVCIPGFIVVLNLIINGVIKLQDYQYNRIMAWINPTQYSDNARQQRYSISAIGSGQLWGKGLHNTSFTSIKNGNFVSESHTDFIFSIVGEELGFVGCLAVMILLLLVVTECILIAHRARNLSGRLICCGVAAWIGFQGFINICVASGLLPNTGVTLPFISYGLTSLISLYMAIGVVLNIGLQCSVPVSEYSSGEKVRRVRHV